LKASGVLLSGGTPTWEGHAMKSPHCGDDMVDLGAISTETRGAEPLGIPEAELGNYDIGADD